MVLIFSQEYDLATNKVIDWLRFYNISFRRVNPEDLTSLSILENSDGNILSIKNELFPIENIKFIWYRRWYHFSSINKTDLKDETIFEEVNFNLKNYELSSYSEYIFYKLDNIKWLNHPNHSSINKLVQLNVAKKTGLKIPVTEIVNNRKRLLELFNEYTELITKPLNRPPENISYGFYTNRISYEDILQFPDFFIPSLIQVEVKKKYEIRVFVIEQDLYATAIFSQFSEDTSIDFRKAEVKRPIRMVPYLLPLEIKSKILALMKSLNLNCGSIDLIKSEKDDIIFLEVNPVGQFSDYSQKCNYYLEEKIVNLFKK